VPPPEVKRDKHSIYKNTTQPNSYQKQATNLFPNIEQIDEDSDEEEDCEVGIDSIVARADSQAKKTGILQSSRSTNLPAESVKMAKTEIVHDPEDDEQSRIRMTAYAAGSGQKVKLTDLKHARPSKSAVVEDDDGFGHLQ
jgi:hypothetical protein